MDCETLKHLIDKCLEGKATPAETDQLNRWYDSFDGQKDLYPPDLAGLAELTARNFQAVRSKLGLG